MGALCPRQGRDPEEVFEYIYGQDDKEMMIPHYDKIPCYLDSIQHNIDDAQSRLKKSEKRFKDITVSSQPLILKSGDKKLHCTFERPERFLKRDGDLKNKSYKIFSRQNLKSSNINIRDDMMQYFGVFLCYLADHPEIIDQVVLTGSNSYGIAAVYMVHDGRRQPIYIDDYILCHEDYPLFSLPIKDTQMWPCLLEKAWFKYKSALDSGIDKIHPLELFKSFLMYPIRPIYLDQSPAQNKKLVERHLIEPLLNRPNSGTIVTSKLKPEHKIGLSGKKHYYLIKVFELDGNIYYYFRNPCGEFDFRGLLQLKDIPQELLQRLIKVTGQYPPPGNFLLNQQQFEEQIEMFFVVKYNPLAPIVTETQIPFNNYDEEVYIKFDISKDQPIGLRIHQRHKVRGYDPMTCLIASCDQNNITAGMQNEEACFGLNEANVLNTDMQNFMPGTYLMRAKRKSGQVKKERDVTKMVLEGLFSEDVLIGNASQELNFRFYDKDSDLEGQQRKYQYKAEFYEILKKIAQKELDEGKGVNDGQLQHVIIWMGDIVIVYVNNITTKDINSLEVNFSELTNLNCINHKISKGYSPLKMTGKDTLIIFEKANLTQATQLGYYSICPF